MTNFRLAACHLLPPEQATSFAEREEIGIEGDAYRHLFRSRRLAVGDRLRVVDGRGRARLGQIAEIDRRSARVSLGEPLDSREPSRELRLWVGTPRPERGSWLVEKATELGVAEIRFVATQRTPRDYGAGRLERLRRVAAAAVEQCHRSRLPSIEGVLDWAAATEKLTQVAAQESAPEAVHRAAAFVLHPGGPGLVSLEPEGPGPVDLWVGPEGGFTADEVDRLVSLGVRPAGLGPTILRVETAALAALAILVAGG